jgi:hypothetical protein
MLCNEKEIAFPPGVKPVSENSKFYDLDELGRCYGRAVSSLQPHDDDRGDKQGSY